MFGAALGGGGGGGGGGLNSNQPLFHFHVGFFLDLYFPPLLPLNHIHRKQKKLTAATTTRVFVAITYSIDLTDDFI